MRLLVVGAGMYVTGRADTGPGTILASLCESSRALPLEQVTIAATNPDNAAVVDKAAQRLNERLGTSLEVDYHVVESDPAAAVKMLADQASYDAVIISVPDHLHYAYAKATLEAGMHTMLVKPFVETLREAKELTALATEKKRFAVVEFHKRFDEANRYAKGLIQAGEIGDPLYATVRYSQRINVPTEIFRGWAERTNIFQYLAVHYVDLMSFLTGYRPERVSAVGSRSALSSLGVDTFDSVLATIEWSGPEERRFACQIACNWIDPVTSSAMSDQRYEMVGSRGRIDLDQKNRGIDVVNAAGGLQAVNPYFSSFLPAGSGHDVFQGYGHSSVASFVSDVAALKSGDKSMDDLPDDRPTFEASQVSTAVVEAVNASLEKNGDWMQVPR